MSGNPIVSVVMPIYKHSEEQLTTAIYSILNQTFNNFELIITDGSDDTQNFEIISLINDKRIRYFKIKGYINCLNYGISQAKGKYIARMDSDDISRKDRCERQLKIFENNPEISICSGTVEEFSDNKESVDALRVVPETNEEIIEFAKKRNPFNHPCVMYKKSAVEAAGNYQDFYLLEDYYLWVRMILKKYKGYNIQNPLLSMRAGSDMYKRRAGWNYTKSQRKLLLFMRNHGMIEKKLYIKNCVIRSIASLIPNMVRKLMFEKVLRQ